MYLRKIISILCVVIMILSIVSPFVFASDIEKITQQEEKIQVEEDNDASEETKLEEVNDDETILDEEEKSEQEEKDIDIEETTLADEINQKTDGDSIKELNEEQSVRRSLKGALPNATKTINDGIYTIATSLNTNFVLDVNGGSKNNGANVALYTNGNNENQQFRICYQSDGYYTIQAVHSGKMLDVHGAGTKNETNVEQYASNDGDNQKWIIQKADNNSYYIISKCNGLYLDVYEGRAKNGTNIQMYQGNNGSGQKFVLKEKKVIQPEKTIENGIYKISTALNSKFALDVSEASKTNGANIALYTSGNGNNQKFKVTCQEDGYYTIQAVHSGKMLDVHGAGTKNETNVEQYESNGGDNQKWIIQKIDNHSYSIISKCNGLYLDVNGGRAADGTNIQMYEETNGAGQRFVFTEIDENQSLEDGVYKIATAVNTGFVLDVAGKSMENSANVQINENGNGKNQRFQITYQGQGYYTIQAMHSKKMLDVHGAGTKSGTNVEQYESNGGDNQLWLIKEANNGYYYVVSKCNGLYLDVYGGIARRGVNVQMYQFNGGSGQKFKFRKVEEKQTIEDGTYKIATALNTNMLLDIEGGSKINGANVGLWLRNNTNNQKFNIAYQGDGYYTIKALHSGKSLDVAGAGKKNETNVVQYSSSGEDNQKWEIRETEDGFYSIISKCNGLYLDVYGGNARNGANIQMYEANNGLGQKFSFDDQYYGIDVSRHQGTIDFAELSKTAVDFMIIRAGFGRDDNQEDKQFATNYAQAKKYGIPVGVYWYSYAQTVEQAQLEAKNCLKAISGKNYELPIFFDIEDPSQAWIDPQTQTDMCIAFCEEIKSAGFKKVGIYTGKYWLKNHIDLTRIPDDYRLWIASYGTNTGEPQWEYAYTGRHEIWQYSSTGSVAGIEGPVDMNICYERFF